MRPTDYDITAALDAIEASERPVDHPTRLTERIQKFAEKVFQRDDVRERFWLWVDMAPGQGPQGECWEWSGTRMKEYGHFYLSRRPVIRIRVHRLVFFLDRGYWPEPFCCHRCDNHPCCNPAHLYAGTHDDNMHDMVLRGRSLTGDRSVARVYRERMIRGESHPKAKFTNDCIRTIRMRILAGETRIAVAADYGVSFSAIGRIASGATWRHVQ